MTHHRLARRRASDLLESAPVGHEVRLPALAGGAAENSCQHYVLYLLEVMNEDREDTNLGTFHLVIEKAQDGSQAVPPQGALPPRARLLSAESTLS